MDQVHGTFEACLPQTWSGDVQYKVFVTAERAVAIRTGGQLSGTQGGRAMAAHAGGLLGVLLYKWFFEKGVLRRQAEREKALEGRSLDELLTLHPKNLQLPFWAVKRAQLLRQRFSLHGQAAARLVIERQRGDALKLLLRTPEQVEACRALLEGPLAGRLAVDPKLTRASRAA